MRRMTVALLMLLLVILAACTQPAEPPAGDTGQEEAPEEAPAEPTEEEAPAEGEASPTTGEEATDEEATGEEELMVAGVEECGEGQKIKEIAAVDPLTVQFTMCGPDPAFEAKVAFEGFGIQPAEHIQETGGGGELLEKPIGTGPYMLEAWNRGDSLVMKRFEEYWGEPAKDETMVLRWASEGAARLLELQSGQVDQISFVSPGDFETVQNDSNLELLPSANPNILYLAFTNTVEPFNNPDVRRAIAMGIDRQRLVDNFYPEGSEVPDFFTPCTITNGCVGDPWYEYDPEAARELLAEAGFADGFDTKIYYRDVFRVYLPEPGQVAVEIQTQLQENLGINAEVVVMESGEFIAESTAGNLDGLYLLGWGADYPHVTNFLDFHFSKDNAQFGDPYPEIYEPLQEASNIADPEEAKPLYEEANNAIREHVPMIPVAHGAAADAALTTAEGAHVRPFGAIKGAVVDTPDDTFVYMQAAEPISLYCADESDGETFRACAQMVESLLAYEMESGETVPGLATACEPNEDGTVWTCNLREGVKFHDGSTLDANDVVQSYVAGLDAASEYHTGNTGAFQYHSYLWGLWNAEEEGTEE